MTKKERKSKEKKSINKKDKDFKNIVEEKEKETDEGRDDFENLYKRAIADYQNLLKQSAKEKQEFAKYANEQLLHQLIPVYDNLKTSLKHTDENIEGSPWAEGVKYIVKQFSDFLESVGVEEIKTVGEKFDHATMEAMKGEGDIVKQELRPGYKLNSKIIIAAKVELGEK